MNRCVQLSLFVRQHEGGHVWGRDCCINDEDEDEPIPHSLEGWVVKHSPGVNPLWLHFVLWKHVQTKWKYLNSRKRFWHYISYKQLSKTTSNLQLLAKLAMSHYLKPWLGELLHTSSNRGLLTLYIFRSQFWSFDIFCRNTKIGHEKALDKLNQSPKRHFKIFHFSKTFRIEFTDFLTLNRLFIFWMRWSDSFNSIPLNPRITIALKFEK